MKLGIRHIITLIIASPLKNQQAEHAGKGFIYNNSQYINSDLKKSNVTPINN